MDDYAARLLDAAGIDRLTTPFDLAVALRIDARIAPWLRAPIAVGRVVLLPSTPVEHDALMREIARIALRDYGARDDDEHASALARALLATQPMGVRERRGNVVVIGRVGGAVRASRPSRQRA